MKWFKEEYQSKAMQQPDNVENVDILIAGGGCAGLSLAMALASQPSLRNKRIVIIEKDASKANDRTWCFWEQGIGPYDDLLQATWRHIGIGYGGEIKHIDLGDYRYKLLRGADFYRHAAQVLSLHPNIEIVHDQISYMTSTREAATFTTGSGTTYRADIGFNSLPPILNDTAAIHMLQHFKGLWVQSNIDVFDANTAILMDFNIDQEGDCRFIYVLPLNAREALIEYTIFSEKLLEPSAYDHALNAYIKKHFMDIRFEIKEEEFGVIPMSSQRFPLKHSARIWNIGTAGGQTKASTGYTFYNIQKHSQLIAQALANNQMPPETIPFWQRRFTLYDHTLLEVLHHRYMPGSEIFARIFTRNTIDAVFKFLSNESHIWQELGIMWSVPTRIFLPAATKVLWKQLLDN